MTLDHDDIQQRLARHPFLKGMNAGQIEVLSRSATPVTFEEGQIVFRTGEAANGFFLIEDGAIAIESRQDGAPAVTIDTVSAGEPLGWSWLFPPYEWQFDARAIKPTKALCFSGILLHQYRDSDLTLSHELFQRMSHVMVRRLQAARNKLADWHKHKK